MHPIIHENYTSVLIALALSFTFGWIWHGPLFGKLWMKLMKIPSNTKMDPKKMIKSMVIGLIGTAILIHVMVYTTNIWRASVWGVGTDAEWYEYGFWSGFYTWLGFYVPMFLGSVAWEARSWSLFIFNVVYHLLNLQIIAMCVSYFFAQ